MSRMVSRWESKFKVQTAELQGYIHSNGEIRYTLIRSNRNLGQVSESEKDEIIKRFKMTEVFNKEEEAKLDFEYFGII